MIGHNMTGIQQRGRKMTKAINKPLLYVVAGALSVLIVAVMLYGGQSVGAQDTTPPTDPPTPTPTDPDFTLEVVSYSPSLNIPEPAGRPAFATFTPREGNPDGRDGRNRRSHATRPWTDADVNKPAAVAMLSFHDLSFPDLTGFSIYRSITPQEVGAEVNLELDAAEYQVVVPESQGYTPSWYNDWDVVPGYQYQWKVIAHRENGDSVTKVKSVQLASADYMSAYSMNGGVKLRFEPYHNEDAMVLIDVKRIDNFGSPAHPLPLEGNIRIYADTNLIEGHFYHYRANYYGESAEGEREALLDEPPELVALAGVYDPTRPSDITATFADQMANLSWGRSAKHNSQVAYYKVMRRPFDVLDKADDAGWNPVATTRHRRYVDRMVESDKAYQYRVVPVSIHEYEDEEPSAIVDVNRQRVTCTVRKEQDGVMQSVQAPIGEFRLWTLPKGFPIYRLTARTIVYSGIAEGVNGYAFDAEGNQCTAVPADGLEVKRRVIYQHVVDESCDIDPESGRRSSCDVIGGSAETAFGVLEEVAFHVIEPLLVREHLQIAGWAILDLDKGLHRYEYQVCTTGMPKICSPPLWTTYHMVGTNSIPFLERQ